jgi:hypothetical protein
MVIVHVSANSIANGWGKSVRHSSLGEGEVSRLRNLAKAFARSAGMWLAAVQKEHSNPKQAIGNKAN